MKPALDARALQYACDRVEDFAVVNRGRPLDDRIESILLWLGHLGLEEEVRTQFDDWANRFLGENNWGGELLLGLAVGLLVNQFNHDNP